MQLTVVSPVQPSYLQVVSYSAPSQTVAAPATFGGPQAVLKLAQDVIAQNCRFATGRADLVEAAVAAGRTRSQAAKASSMRLAQWARRKTSAI